MTRFSSSAASARSRDIVAAAGSGKMIGLPFAWKQIPPFWLLRRSRASDSRVRRMIDLRFAGGSDRRTADGLSTGGGCLLTSLGVFSFSVQQHTVGFICSHSPAASKRLIFYRFLMAGLERSISSRFKRLRVQNSSHDWPSLGPQLTDFEYMDRCSKPDQKPEEYPTVTCAALCVSPCFLPYVIARKTRDPLF